MSESSVPAAFTFGSRTVTLLAIQTAFSIIVFDCRFEKFNGVVRINLYKIGSQRITLKWHIGYSVLI